MKHEKDDERGFILITSLVLLSILTILGTMSFFKSSIEIKVSSSSQEAVQAHAAMNVGLDKVYSEWKAQTVANAGEFIDLGAWIANKTGTPPAVGNALEIYVNSYPSDVTALGGNPPSRARIYTLAANGTLGTGTAWDVGNDPQVAVWVTSFKPPATNEYPYSLDLNLTEGVAYHVTSGVIATGTAPGLSTTGLECSDCALVVYSLGRSGDSRRLAREYMSTIDTNLNATGAMVNAPAYTTLEERCGGAVGGPWASDLTAGTIQNTHMIDATQSPGGVAMRSNNGINIANGSKPYPGNTGTSLKNIDPWVVYDPGKVDKVDYPKINAGNMSALAATVVVENDNMDYFSAADAQLFNLDAYREAANRIAGFSTELIAARKVDTGGNRLGNYDVLKDGGTVSGVTYPNNNGHARMGTIQWADFEYNVNNQIPMYGIVRVMIPVKRDGSNMGPGSCSTVKKFKLINGDLPTGRLIVYGGALFDFFWDRDEDSVYEPHLLGANKDRVLTPTEALISKKINVDTHIAFNPVMDANIPKSDLDDVINATGAAGTDGLMDSAVQSMDFYGSQNILEISTYPNGSPSWDLTSDALPGSDGAMDTMDRIRAVADDWSGEVHNGSVYMFTGYTNGAWALTANEKDLLDYYIRTTANASEVVWSHKTAGAIETNKTSFYIDTESDLERPAGSSADLFHSFLPSGYVHGWKRAMEVTGLAGEPSGGTTEDNKTIWSEELLPGPGIADTDSQFYANRHDYFYVTRDDTTSIDYPNGKVYIDKNFADIPAEMYAGGLVDMHQHANVSGVVYTPDQLELELKDSPADAYQYINGIIITGAGVYMKDATGGAGRAIIAYDDTSIDNLPTNNPTITVGRKYWQELK